MAALDQAETRERLLEAMLASSLDSVIVIDEAGQVVEFNPSAERTFGFSRDMALGRPIADLIVPERHRAAHVEGLARYVAGGVARLIGRRAELDARRADGTEFPVELALSEVRSDGQRLFLASLRDLTQQRRSERALRDSEARLAGFMNNAPVGMYLKDAADRYTMVNPEMSRVFGLPIGEVLGKTAAELFTPEDAAMIAGHDARVRVTMRPTAVEEYLADREEYEWTLVVRFPIDRGHGIEIGGFDIDISALKASEAALRRSTEALMQAEKLAAMGSLLAGVSHELNNPLSAIIGQSIMLEEDLDGRPEAERAASIRAQAERCARIVQTFLAMARQRPAVRAAVDANDVIDDVLTIAEYGLRTNGVRVETQLAPALPPISADKDQLHQAVINLVINAQQALEGRADGAVTLSTAHVDGEVRIEVADNGPGVSPEVAHRIFEPFFSTKPLGAGTGVGLASAQGTIEAHGGRLELVQTGQGACFRISLPVGTGNAAAVPDAPEDIAPVDILIVDDEPDVAATLGEMLRRDGHRVAVALSVAEARERIADGSVDVLLSDIRMPDDDGISFHRWLSGAHPQLADRTIFVTGDTLGTHVQAFLHESDRPVIEKPFTRATVRAALAALGR